MERIIVVTGATDGIGKATVLELLERGATVLGVARDRRKAKAMQEAVGSNRLFFVHADLSSVREVDRLAEAIRTFARARESALGALVHVAGTVATRRETTVDGYERTFAVNHLAVQLLTTRLLPDLIATGGTRVLVVSSRAHRWGRIRFRDVMLKRCYWLLTAYAQSKLANVLYVRAMARRIDPAAVSFYAVDPGLVDTGIVAKTSKGIERWIWSWRRKAGTDPAVPARHLSALAVDPIYAFRTGRLWRDGGAIRPARRSGDVAVQDRLLALGERLVATALRE